MFGSTQSNTQVKMLGVLKNPLQGLLFAAMSMAIVSCGSGGGSSSVDAGVDDGVDDGGGSPPAPLTRAVDIYYVANPLGVNEAFVTSADGSVQRSSTSASTEFEEFRTTPSPDGRYLASVRSVGNGTRLYVDDLTDDNEAVERSADLVANGDVLSFRWSPDSNYLAYQADQDVDKTVELYVVPVTGGAAVKLHPDKTSGEVVSRYEWSPDSQQLAFIANHDNLERGELYVANRDGSGNLRVNSPDLLLDGAAVTRAYWTPDSSRLAFRFDEIVGVEFVLYAVNADGSDEVQLSGAGSVDATLPWLPDGSAIVYLADQDVAGQRELYRASSDGTVNIKLNGALTPGGDVGFTALVSPDGAFFAYRADQDINNEFDLYVSAIDGTGNLKLSDLTTNAALQNVSTFRWSPDSSQIAYRADQNTAGLEDLFVVSVTGGPAQRVSSGVMTDTKDFFWSSDSQRLAYIADQDTSDVFELYVVTPNLGGVVTPPYKINGSMVAEGDVGSFRWSRGDGGTSLLYRADQDTDAVEELYVVANANVANAIKTPVKISTPLAPGSTVSLWVGWLPVFNP